MSIRLADSIQENTFSITIAHFTEMNVKKLMSARLALFSGL